MRIGSCPLLSAETPTLYASPVLSYKLQNDSIGWLSIDKDLGLVTVKRAMDRESPYVTDSNYKVLVVAYDNGKCRTVSLMVSFFSNEPNRILFYP